MKRVSREVGGPFYGMITTYIVLYVELEPEYALHAVLYGTVFTLSFNFPYKLTKFLAICYQTEYLHSGQILYTVQFLYMFSDTLH